LKGVNFLIEINNSLIIQAALLIGLMLILNKMLFQPVLRFLEQRRTKVQGDEEEANRFSGEADRMRIEFDEGLNKARLQAMEDKGRLRDLGAEEGKTIIAKVQKDVEEEMPSIKVQIEAESKLVLAELEKRRSTIAKEIAEKILGRRL
jgi:F-type H+-transporting ATPase subunit b